jgi:hypothetical protein
MSHVIYLLNREFCANNLSSVCLRGSNFVANSSVLSYAQYSVLTSALNYAARYMMHGKHKSGRPDETLICTGFSMVPDGIGCSQRAISDLLCSLSEIF